MEPIYDEMFKFWKLSWEAYKSNMALMQEQGEKMMDFFFSQAHSLQEDTRQNTREVMSAGEKAQQTYLKALEDTFSKMSDFMNKTK
jgi:hypothetical protein